MSATEDRLHRCTLQVCEPAGDCLGAGVLVAPDRVLTCCHVVGDRDRVDLRDAANSELLAGAAVGERGHPDDADDLALLELDAPLPGRGKIRFVSSTLDDAFWTVGFPSGMDQVHGVVGGPSQYHGWLQIDSLGTRKIEPGFSGGAVWVEAKGAAVGLVTHYAGDGVAYVIPAAQILAFWRPAGAEAAERCAGNLKRAARKLESRELRDALVEAAPIEAWRRAAGRPEDLAEELCLETGPDELAVGFHDAYVRLDDEGRGELAERVFDLLMEALPAALLSRWQIELPAEESREARLQVVGLVLAEMALAAAEGGAAVFHRRPDRPDSTVPRAVHRVPAPGEVGADPDGEDGVSELTMDIATRLALDCGETPGSPTAALLGQVATLQAGGDQPPLFDLDDLDATYGEASRGTLLKLLNKWVALPTSSGSRRLYFVADEKRDKALIEALGRHLSGLKIVFLNPSDDQYESTAELLHRLRVVFHRRKRERSQR